MSSINLADIIAVVISACALIIALKSRRNGLREKVFDEQISVFKELFVKISFFESLIMDYNTFLRLSSNEFEENREKVWNVYDDLQDYYSAVEIFIPDEIDKQFFKYHNYIDSIIKKINIGKEEINIVELSNQNYYLQESIRDFLGLEKLSNENRQLSKSRYL